MNYFEKNMSPVEQDFIWVADYFDGTHLAEFDFFTKKENSFYGIDRSKLIRFGLVGHGMKMIFEAYSGIFKINGQMFEFIYKVGDKQYYLTGQPKMYNDIITYKDAESTINLKGGGTTNTSITQFNFGYKANLHIDGINFNFKPICKIPFGQPVHMNVWIVADKDLDGVVQIKQNGFIVDEIKAPLRTGIGGEFNWVVKL